MVAESETPNCSSEVPEVQNGMGDLAGTGWICSLAACLGPQGSTQVSSLLGGCATAQWMHTYLLKLHNLKGRGGSPTLLFSEEIQEYVNLLAVSLSQLFRHRATCWALRLRSTGATHSWWITPACAALGDQWLDLCVPLLDDDWGFLVQSDASVLNYSTGSEIEYFACVSFRISLKSLRVTYEVRQFSWQARQCLHGLDTAA